MLICPPRVRYVGNNMAYGVIHISIFCYYIDGVSSKDKTEINWKHVEWNQQKKLETIKTRVKGQSRKGTFVGY